MARLSCAKLALTKHAIVVITRFTTIWETNFKFEQYPKSTRTNQPVVFYAKPLLTYHCDQPIATAGHQDAEALIDEHVRKSKVGLGARHSVGIEVGTTYGRTSTVQVVSPLIGSCVGDSSYLQRMGGSRVEAIESTVVGQEFALVNRIVTQE